MRPLEIVLVVVLVGVLTMASCGLGASRDLVPGPAPHHEAVALVRSPSAAQVLKQRAAPAVTAYQMGVVGIAPEMTSINWTVSSPSFGNSFSSYELEYSYDGATNWTLYKNITSQSTTTLGYTWCPGCALWWREYTWDSSPLGLLLENNGALLDLVQPSVATTWFVWSSGSSVDIDWSNPATYGGNVSFLAYNLWESVNGSAYGLESFITNVSQTFDLVSGLLPDTNYSFYVATTDSLSDATVGGSYSTNSSITSFNTPFPLSATAGVNRSAADVGQSLTFDCSTTGGLPAYTYGWAFGDGGTAATTVFTVSHTYSVPGSYTASCTVDDHTDSSATGLVSVTISAAPTVAAPTASPVGSVFEGRSVTFNVSATVGSGGLSYSWAGLPSGCSSANASNITCDPTGSGTFSIVVTVTDSNGGSAQSVPLNFTVKPTFLGLPATEGYGLAGGIAAAAVAAALAVVLVARRRKRRAAPPP